MCLSASALALFLNMIAAPVSTTPGQITVHAEVGDTVWTGQGDQWCTKRPAEIAFVPMDTLEENAN